MSPDPIRLDENELLAAVPALLGFTPEDSLILIVLEDEKVLMTVRIDLPLPQYGDVVAHQLRDVLAEANAATAVLVAVVGGGALGVAGEPPCGPLVHRVCAALETLCLSVVHAVWTSACSAGAAWHCYGDPQRCQGTIPDPAASHAAAAHAAAGLVIYRNRQELVDLVAPVADDVLDRRAQLLDDLLAMDGPNPRTGLRMIGDAISEVPERTEPLSDDEVVRLVAALADSDVRDASLSFATGTQARAAEQLWLELTRGCPGPLRAEPAVLLALFAYLRGDGPLAQIAMDKADEACPGHRLSGMVRRALNLGMAPTAIVGLAQAAVGEAQRILGQHDEPHS